MNNLLDSFLLLCLLNIVLCGSATFVVLVFILSDLAIKTFKKFCILIVKNSREARTDSILSHKMTHEHTISSSADLELLVEGDSLTRVRTARETLDIVFNPYEMNRKDLKHLLLLSDLVVGLSMDEMTVDCQLLESEVAAAIADFSNLQTLTIWIDDVFNLGKLVSPIQSQPASRFLTSVRFSGVRISAERASRISKAFEYNNALESFEARNVKQGVSDLVPILRGSHRLKRMDLNLYHLTRTEFFALCRFFVKSNKHERLKRLEICIEPATMVFDRAYLKLGAVVVEKNVAENLYLYHMSYSTAGNTQLVSYVETIGGFKL